MTGGINFKANERDRCENGGMQNECERDTKNKNKKQLTLPEIVLYFRLGNAPEKRHEHGKNVYYWKQTAAITLSEKCLHLAIFVGPQCFYM